MVTIRNLMQEKGVKVSKVRKMASCPMFRENTS